MSDISVAILLGYGEDNFSKQLIKILKKENSLMKKRNLFLALFLVLSFTLTAVGQIKTNKDKLLTIAVQGKVAPAKIATSYTTTWDGKAKLAIGVGGLNYNLKLGGKIFGWASGDRATMGVATTGEDGAWTNYTSIGNEVKILGGDARGEKGVIIGKLKNMCWFIFRTKY